MAGGTWDPTTSKVRPGLYINFVESAIAQIAGGARGVVAIPLKTYGANATAKTVYTVETEKEATDLFGSANIQSIKFALQGGAKEVLVYTMPSAPLASDYADMRNTLEAYPFNVFVFDDENDATEQSNTLTWVQANRDEGKHFTFVAGGNATDDQDPTAGNSRSTTLADDYVVNLISGVDIDGTDYQSSAYAPYIAGLVAGTAINQSITYAQVPVSDVTKRLRNSEIKTALQAGSLVLVNDGEKVKVEQGLATSKEKVRNVRARQAIATDIMKTASDSYIGKVDNNAPGQSALIGAVKAYLERLEVSNVLTGPEVGLDPQYESVGDQVYLLIGYTEVDSMEKIYLTINL